MAEAAAKQIRGSFASLKDDDEKQTNGNSPGNGNNDDGAGWGRLLATT
jgi:hypothetical protein